MSDKTYRRLTQFFLLSNSLFWLPWGFINLLWPESWSGQVIPNMDVFDLSSSVTRTEVRAMYGGLQMAIGAFAIFGALHGRFRESALVFFVFALSGLAMCRLGSMMFEGERSYLSFTAGIAPGQYNQVGLAMYELPNMLFAWIVLALRPRGSAAPASLA